MLVSCIKSILSLNSKSKPVQPQTEPLDQHELPSVSEEVVEQAINKRTHQAKNQKLN